MRRAHVAAVQAMPPATGKAARVLAAAAIAASSLLVLRFAYHGTCPPDELGAYAAVFVFPAAFLWLAVETALPGLRLVGLRGILAGLASLALGVMTYLAIAGGVWLVDPWDGERRDQPEFRALDSVFWNTGLLRETGNFKINCGD